MELWWWTNTRKTEQNFLERECPLKLHKTRLRDFWKRQGTWHLKLNAPLNAAQMAKSGGKSFYWKAIWRRVCLEMLSHHSLLSSLLELFHLKLNKQVVISLVFITILIIHTRACTHMTLKRKCGKTDGEIHFSVGFHF